MRFRQLAVCFFPALLLAQQPPPDPFAAVAPRMQQFVDRGEASGIVTLIASKDRVLHLAAVGKTALDKERPMRTDDLFWIASMSKPVTAVAVGILVDDGKLKFDDPVAKYLPEFGGSHRAVTLRHLLTHTSGVGEMMQRDGHWTLAETSRKIAAQPLLFQPGARWSYSTAGFDVLGRVVEVVSGMPFDEVLQKRVFTPLGMKNTTFWIAPADEERYALSYRWNPQASKLERTSIPYLYGTAPTDRSRPPLGGAGLFSTAEDVARFYRMMLNRGTLMRAKILTPETVAEMTRKQTGDLAARPGMPWGLGFAVVEDPSKMEGNQVLSPGSFGHGGAFSTQSWADPAQGLIRILMMQRDNKGNPDNTDVRIAFNQAAAQGVMQTADPNSQFHLSPDALPYAGVPKGEIRGPFVLPSNVYPGTQHTYWVYVPAQYNPAVPASLMIFQDGQAFKDENGDMRAQNVMDNLIFRHEIPVMIGVFINPGRRPDQPEPDPQRGWGDQFTNRPTEYNSLDDKYARVVTEELMPELYKQYNISKDPDRHGIGGSSSGAIAAFTVAWERPNEFHKVLSNVGSFVNLRGGYVYPEKVLAAEKKPIRVFMVDGRNDNRGQGRGGRYDDKMDWFYQNVRLMKALTQKGYEVNYSWSMNLHGQKYLSVVLPEMMRWLWRDSPLSTDPNDTVERGFRVPVKH